jgi:regulatory protein
MAGEITAIKLQSKRDNRVNIYLDGDFAFGIMKSLAIGLHIGQRLSDEHIEELKAKDTIARSYQRAMRLIRHRQRTEWELRRYFNKQSVDEVVQEEVIKRLKEENLVDDRAFAEAWIENRNTFRPRSAFALSVELKKKGVSPELVEAVLLDFDDEAAARLAAAKGSRRWRRASENEFKRRLSDYLRRRGFLYSTISPIIRDTWRAIADEESESEVFE